jgi:hypothetical protein
MIKKHVLDVCKGTCRQCRGTGWIGFTECEPSTCKGLWCRRCDGGKAYVSHSPCGCGGEFTCLFCSVCDI